MNSTDASPRLRIRWGRIFVVLVLLAAAAYAAAIALVPTPAPVVALEVEAEQEFVLDGAPVQAIADAQGLPTAVGWLHEDEVWANSDEAYPIASISKLVTVLVTLEQQPVEPGAEGPVHVWTEEDRARQDAYLAQDGVAFPIPVGTEVSVRQMLALALVPSANDFAAAYAYSVFGDNDAFLAAVDDWAARNGIESLVLAEPTGMDESNAATASDVLRIARLALQNPTIAEFTALPYVELPWGIGVIESTNLLFDVLPDVRGVKTGRTSIAGYNLAAAQGSSASGRDLVKMSVVLGRPTEADRIDSSVAALTALDTGPQTVDLVADGELIGTATTVDELEIPLIAADAASTVMLPGEASRRTVELLPLEPGRAGQAAGTVRISTPTGDSEVAVLTEMAFEQPGYWWKFTHPGKLFGGS